MVLMQTCVICGKKKREVTGWWHPVDYLKSIGVTSISIGPTWDGRVFACFRCLKKLEKAKADSDWAKMMKVKEQYEAEKKQGEKEQRGKLESDLDTILTCHSGWVKIMDIRDALNEMGHNETSKFVSAFIRKKGLTVKRRTHGVFFAYIK